jgi:hypothetical protein
MSFGLITFWTHFSQRKRNRSIPFRTTQSRGTSPAPSAGRTISESSSYDFQFAGLDKLLGDGLLETGEQPIYWQFGNRFDTAHAGVWE